MHARSAFGQLHPHLDSKTADVQAEADAAASEEGVVRGFRGSGRREDSVACTHAKLQNSRMRGEDSRPSATGAGSGFTTHAQQSRQRVNAARVGIWGSGKGDLPGTRPA